MGNKLLVLTIAAVLVVMALTVAIQPACAYGGVSSGTNHVTSTHGVPGVPNVPRMPAVPNIPSFHWPGSHGSAGIGGSITPVTHT